LGIATAVGAAGGALIGTGVGAAAGISLLSTVALIGAGAGAIGSQAGYSFTHGNDYDSGEMAISAGIGAGAGALSSVAAVTGGGAVTNALISGGASSAQYMAIELFNGRTPDALTAAANFATGSVVGGAFSAATGTVFENPFLSSDLQYFVGARAAMPPTSQSISSVAISGMVAPAAATSFARQMIRSVVASVTSKYIRQYWEE
jgi:hypothetical protein